MDLREDFKPRCDLERNEVTRVAFPTNDFFRNDSRLPLFEEHHPYTTVAATKLQPVRYMPIIGPRLEIVTDFIPPTILQDHWVRVLGGESYRPRFCGFNEDKLHFVQFPLQSLKPDRHVIAPEELYQIYTKEFIGQIDCSQAPRFSKQNAKFPCVVKSTLSAGARAVFKCFNQKDFNAAVEYHEKHEIPYIINKLIDFEEEYCIQFCVNKQGACTLIGATKPMFNSRGLWAGSVIDMEDQQKLRDQFRNTVEPVSSKLQSMGFFGFVGCDVIVDKEGNHYVVDINPRLCGSTPLLFANFQMRKKGWKFGIILKDWVNYDGSEEELIALCEQEKTRGEVLLFACGRKDVSSPLQTVLSVFSSSVSECWEIFYGMFDSYTL